MLEGVQAEAARLPRVIVNAWRNLGPFDFEALEQATPLALDQARARPLEELLEDTAEGGQPTRCGCGSPMRCKGRWRDSAVVGKAA